MKEDLLYHVRLALFRVEYNIYGTKANTIS